MIILGDHLDLERCPHCSVDRPNLARVAQCQTADFRGSNSRIWRAYTCGRCGGVITAAAAGVDQEVSEVYPAATEVDESIPHRARNYLQQSLNSISSPAGATMLAASAVDAMLKAKNYKSGSLYSRIDRAVDDNMITHEMAKWAHAVRLDANEQRHSDEDAPIPNMKDAQRTLDFALALGQFMFVLPERVERGLEDAQPAE